MFVAFTEFDADWFPSLLRDVAVFEHAPDGLVSEMKTFLPVLELLETGLSPAPAPIFFSSRTAASYASVLLNEKTFI